jgi:type IV pilus assembly protein PilC
MKKLTSSQPFAGYFALAPVLFRQLASAVRHNLPMREVTSILAQDDQTSVSNWHQRLQNLTRALQSGASLSAAMDGLGYAFPKATVSWVALAEQKEALQKGGLANALDALADDAERENKGRGELAIAQVWPAALVVGLVVCLAIASLFVFPAYEEMASAFSEPLPGLTLATIGVADLLTQYWWAWLLPLGVFALLYKKRFLPAAVLYEIDNALHALWFVRPVVRARFVARVTDGNPALQRAALAHIGDTVTSRSLRRVLQRVDAALAVGTPLSQAFAAEKTLPKRLGLYCQLGEKMGNFANPLSQLQQDVDDAHQLAIAQFERAVVILIYSLLGSAIALLMQAMYLPIFKMGQYL